MYTLDEQRADKMCQRGARPANPICQVSPMGAAATVIALPAQPLVFPTWQSGSINAALHHPERHRQAADKQADAI